MNHPSETKSESAVYTNTTANEPPPDKPPEIPKNEIPVYKEPLSYALDNGELDSFKQNERLNTECGEAIESAIREQNNPAKYGMYIDTEIAMRNVIEEFGAERVAWILAGHVKANQHDGYFSQKNKSGQAKSGQMVSTFHKTFV